MYVLKNLFLKNHCIRNANIYINAFMDSEYFCYSWANAMTPREIVFHRKNVEILLKSTSVTICNTNNQEPFDSLDSIFFLN